ncbi:hypothetical protein ACU8NH_09725 [Rhizobium leguminosarum]|jgi:hypothetical protein|uniref:Uncharacterized protein n=2 Tax=Rhizobium leguminosarum TaxID=384 RepID=A0A1B8RHZ1_RHILT|nr:MULTISPECIES: hypothetical protein [Rhizobium]MDH6662195.1 hypothetical protein [Rhizobium sophorae]AOO88650.1 hypothetical protein [Rhizobium leguminosarum bv. trifolii]ASS57549.1 hypothetical protein CHR56_25005 [Rhizobium leguminosarum bv. viciae]AVC49655.1 hypothetical protein RLV_4510 [Rhizobium leguminosarum bv. viciae]AXA38011.1 hypothetical protein DLJ82_0400 [Rhizobium leguminosarum]
MTSLQKIKILLLTIVVAMSGLELGERLAVPGMTGIFTPAEARVGRPLTPVSVAGVARRTVRRCAVGVYYC